MRYRWILAGVAAATTWLGAAAAADSWNGTWVGGFTGGDAVQLIFADDQLVGFFWDGDYLSAVKAMAAANGTVTISWAAATATLTRDGPMTAHLTVQQPGEPDVTVPLAPDTD